MKVKIIKMGMNGEGIGYLNHIPVFVDGALIDEEVDITVVEDHQRYKVGKVNRIVQASAHRIKPKCFVQERCGGCPLMIAQYKKQLDYKFSHVRQSLIKYAQINPKVIQKMVANPMIFGYRNQLKLPCTMENGRLVTGMYVPGTNHFREIKKCIVHEADLERVRQDVLYVLNKHHIQAYQHQQKRGLRFLVIRGFHGRYQCTLISGEDTYSNQLINDMMRIKGMHSLWQSVHTAKKTHEIFGEKMQLLAGERYLPLAFDHLKLQISPRSFFQLHTQQAMTLYRSIAAILPKKYDLMVEAYSGIGVISLYLQDKAKEIIGIESIKDAVVNANQNAKLNGFHHISFVCADAADKLQYISKKRPIDCLVVDPPRSGLDEAMLYCILKSRIQDIVYVSCNPATLAKNLAVLSSSYEVKTIVPIDIFSHTAHVECIVLLSRVKKGKAKPSLR